MSTESFLDSLYSSKKDSRSAGFKKPRQVVVKTEALVPAAHPIELPIGGVAPLNGSIQDLFRRHHLMLNSKRFNNDDAYEKQVMERMIPLDNFFSGKRVKRKPTPSSTTMSARKANQSHLFDLSQVDYPSALILNKLWNEYVIQATSSALSASCFSFLDLHGAEVQVIRSKNACNIGSKGIIVRDSANAITILTVTGKLLILPKDVCDFQVSVGDKVFELSGPSFIRKP